MPDFKISISLLITSLVIWSCQKPAQKIDPYSPDFTLPPTIPGMELVWHDEFNLDGKPNSSVWEFENGFVRNEELQWYQEENAYCGHGSLIIEAKRENVENTRFDGESDDWKRNRPFAYYTSSCLKTRKSLEWLFGRIEVRARIDTARGSWPAIWLLGIAGRWPENGEIDMMEFYRRNDQPIILANTAWGTQEQYRPKWDAEIIPLSKLLENDVDWAEKFHTWHMEWDEQKIALYLDSTLINQTLLTETINADGTNPFLKPQYLLLNLAIGANGGDPQNTTFPLQYEIDYVRVYQKN